MTKKRTRRIHMLDLILSEVIIAGLSGFAAIKRIRWPHLLGGVVVAALIAWAASWASREWSNATARGVSEVRAGVLYRSGQPQSGTLAALRDRYHIRTVISLCQPSAAEATAEEEFCRANGIRFTRLLLEGQGFTESQSAQFLAIVRDPSCQPVLVHCQHGRNRAGYAAAYYRIAIQHWTYEAAIAEARTYGYPEGTAAEEVKSLRAMAASTGPE
jgi:protein tyrosine/serine phosphatase